MTAGLQGPQLRSSADALEGRYLGSRGEALVPRTGGEVKTEACAGTKDPRSPIRGCAGGRHRGRGAGRGQGLLPLPGAWCHLDSVRPGPEHGSQTCSFHLLPSQCARRTWGWEGGALLRTVSPEAGGTSDQSRWGLGPDPPQALHGHWSTSLHGRISVNHTPTSTPKT